MQKILVFCILLIGLSLRLYKIDLPLLEFNPSRQVQTADISRNFYRDGFNILSPTVSYFGREKQKFLVEFPLYNISVAFLYKIFANTNEYVGRLFSILGWVLSFFLLYQLAKKYSGKVSATVAIFFYSLSPLSVLTSRSFQPDQWMLTLSLASIYFIDKSKNIKMFFYLSIIFSSLSMLIKITSILFTLVPVVYLIKKNYADWKFKSIVYVSFAILPAFFWYLYASIAGRAGEVLTGASELSNWFGIGVFAQFKYWSNMFGFENNLALSPIGIALLLVGLATRLKKNQFVLYFWFGSLILYFLLFNKHSMTHEYYHLPFLPIAAIFIGIGAQKIRGNVLLLSLSILIFLVMFLTIKSRAYTPIDRFSAVPDAASAVKRFSSDDDLIIGAMDAGPTLVYYSDRQGFAFEINRQEVAQLYAFYGVENYEVIPPEKDLELLRGKGASIFAAGNLDQFLTNQNFARYMFSHYDIFEQSKNYIIFDLKARK